MVDNEFVQCSSFTERIQETSSRVQKASILLDSRNEIIAFFLRFLLDKNITTGISTAKINKKLRKELNPDIDMGFFDVCRYISENPANDDTLWVVQSYIAKVGRDGTISEDDYIDQAIEKYKEANPNLELTEQNEAFLRNQMKLAFAKLDLNGDGEIDKNEMTSALATFDAGGKAIGTSNSADGKITAAEYDAAQKSLTANNSTFATNNWTNYQQLFGAQKKSEE